MKHKGFTLVEVSLVLGVAGLIFIMVFIALPALWRSERDSARRDDMLTFINTLKNFQTNNNRGALPTFFINNADRNEGYAAYSDDNNVITVYGEKIKASGEVSGNTWVDFYRNYLPDSFMDPNGFRYNLVIFTCQNSKSQLGADCAHDGTPLETLYDDDFLANDYRIYIVLSGMCDGEEVKLSANSRRAAILYKLEAVDGIYCGST